MTSPVTQIPQQRAISAQAWIFMGVLALIWGGSFPANKAALGELGVLTTVAFRVGGAALALWLYILARGLTVPRGTQWIKTCLITGVLNNVVPFSLILWGQIHIASGLAGILNATTTIFSIGLAALVFPDRRVIGDVIRGGALEIERHQVGCHMPAIRRKRQVLDVGGQQSFRDFCPPPRKGVFQKRPGGERLQLLQISRRGRGLFVSDACRTIAGLHLRPGAILPYPTDELFGYRIRLRAAQRFGKHGCRKGF